MKYLQIFENQRKQWSGELEKDEWYFSSFRDNLISSLEIEDYNECIDDLIIISIQKKRADGHLLLYVKKKRIYKKIGFRRLRRFFL